MFTPDPLKLGELYSVPEALSSSLFISGKFHFLSLWATTRDKQCSTITVPEQGGMALEATCVLAILPSVLYQHCGGEVPAAGNMGAPVLRLAYPQELPQELSATP